ncbi:protein phosphatase 1 regulatory subunit 36 [Pholidichthys leucotaenia]
MPKHPDHAANDSALCPGCWVWDDESQTVELVREGGMLRKMSQSEDNFSELQQRAEWLADVHTMTGRGRQSVGNSLAPTHLDTYRDSLLRSRGHSVTMDDVKQAAVGLMQENYLLPIPFCFLDVLRTKELDDVLAALLLYLSCFFELKSLRSKSMSPLVLDSNTGKQMQVEVLAKKDISQEKLAVCYFTLMLDLKREQHPPYHKGKMLPNRTEWMLHACLYSFFCYVAWVTFGRKHLKDIQEEVGRLLYSDGFNTAIKNMTDGDLGVTSTSALLLKMGKPRTSRKRSALSSTINQRSPLMMSLLPSPKERSAHLFLATQARSQSPLKAKHCDSRTLTAELDQQLASLSFGILGKPLTQFSSSTLLPSGEQKNNTREDWQ